jgi:hypothetical protein
MKHNTRQRRDPVFRRKVAVFDCLMPYTRNEVFCGGDYFWRGGIDWSSAVPLRQ